MPYEKRKPPKPKAQKRAAVAPTARDSWVTVDRCSHYSSLCKWKIFDVPNIKTKSLHSAYFEVGGFDFRFLVNPKGDSSAMPGDISLFLQVNNPRSSSFDFYASYKIKIVNFSDDSS
uniref:Uncharacterized protein LOC103946721 n=1 Tax=Rhizophora mucronata TaxID=61149 RepID=A0A2P2N178_RHIMU